MSHISLLSKRIDLVEELKNGRLVLLDSGIHQPIQFNYQPIGVHSEFLEQPTIEITCWRDVAFQYYRHHEDLWGPEEQSTGFSYIRKLGDNRSQISGLLPGEINGDMADEIHRSVTTKRKTVIDLMPCMNTDLLRPALIEALNATLIGLQELAAKGEKLPLCFFDVMYNEECNEIFELVRKISITGAPVLVFRFVGDPEAKDCTMEADLHLIERYVHKRTGRPNEAVTNTGERYEVLVPTYRFTELRDAKFART